MHLVRHRKRFIAPFKWGVVLAAGVLCAGVSLAQTSDSNKSATPDKPSADQQSKQKQAKSSRPPATKLKIQVTSADDKPVANASVYVRFYESGGFLHHEKLEELSFKTNQDGSVKVPEIPQGKILVQVVAKGWRTYGRWFDVEKDEESIQIKLELPPHWY